MISIMEACERALIVLNKKMVINIFAVYENYLKNGYL